jgi:hypothetical protein
VKGTVVSSWLDRLVNVGILLGCALVIVSVAQRLAPRGEQGAVRTVKALSQGDTMPRVAGVDIRRTPKTLFVYLSSTCQFCVNSMGFYRDLLKDPSHAQRGFQFVVVGPEPPDVLKLFAAQHNLVPDHVISAPAGTLGIASTPTLVLVNRSSVVERRWIGELSQAGRASVIGALRKTIPSDRT